MVGEGLGGRLNQTVFVLLKELKNKFIHFSFFFLNNCVSVNLLELDYLQVFACENIVVIKQDFST